MDMEELMKWPFAKRRDLWMRNLLKAPANDIPSGAKNVGLRLALYMNEGREYAFPSLPELGVEVGMSGRMVQTHTLLLQKEKWITADRKRNSGNKYKLRYWWAE